MRRILPVVEGEGDERAVPILIRRVAEAAGLYDVEVCRAHRRGDLPRVLSRFSDFFQTALLEDCPVLWVMDYDCAECRNEVQHVKSLRKEAAGLAQGQAFEFVFMVQEFETLFLADHETMRQVFPDISAECAFPKDPESVRDAKGWISAARPKGWAYKPTQHQDKLAARVDLARLRERSPSFVRFETAVLQLLQSADSSGEAA